MTVKFFGVLFCLILFSFSAFSLSVSVQPQLPVSVLELYPDELGYLVLTVFNDQSVSVENLTLNVSADPGLVLVEGFEEKLNQTFRIAVLASDETKTFLVKVKNVLTSVDSLPEKLLVNVSYGVDQFTNFSGTFIKPSLPVLSVNYVVSEELVVGQDNLLELKFQNLSDQYLANLDFQLVSFKEVDLNVNSGFLTTVLPLSTNSVHVSVNPAPSIERGLHTLLARVSFSDSLGLHVLEKTISFTVKDKLTNWIYLPAIGLILVLIAFVLKKKFSKKETLSEASSNQHE
ncbi:MAG: hypothetical protein Q7S92_04830 [Candidatus Diapherotrites archaeon]|nr:hypothetical protein [Candidatus Diapherotrites archaeon]